MARVHWWTYALILGLMGSFAAQAGVFIPAERLTVGWGGAFGPVAYYGVWVKRDGGLFPEFPDLVTTERSAEIWATRNDEVEQVVVRVAAFDSAGRPGPLSAESQPFVFLPPDGPEPEPEPEPAAQPDPPAPPPALPATASEPARPYDFDGDGTTDLLWRFANPEQLVIWRMRNLEPVDAGLLLPRGTQEIVGSGDFDSDGRADLLFEDLANGSLEIWFMDGLALREKRDVAQPAAWQVEAIGDFDGDGRSDLLGSRGGQAEVLYLDGAMVVSSAVLGSPPWSMLWEAPDFDGDGRADVLFHDVTQQESAAWQVDGDQVVASFEPRLPPWTVGVLVGHGDVDGDGDDDVLWTHPAAGGLRFFFTRPDGSSVAVGSWTLREREKVEAMGDFDGDGRANEVLMRDSVTGENYIAYYNWNGSSGSMPPQRVEIPALDPQDWSAANR